MDDTEPPDRDTDRPAPRPTFGQRWGNTIMTVVLLLIGAAVAVWLARRPNPVTLSIEGEPIVNVDDVLAEADAAFRDLVTQDGAHPPDGAGCWLASPADAAGGGGGLGTRPRMACGPVRLGVSSGDEVWVVGNLSFSPVSGGDGWSARFTGLRRVDTVDVRSLARPDGAGPPPTEGLAPPDAVLRDRQGRRLVGVEAVLGSAEADLRTEAEQAGATIHADAACWYGYRPGDEGRLASDGALWCGPLRAGRASADEHWARLSVSTGLGEVVTAEVRGARLPSLLRTQRLPSGTELWRPDGRPPPSGPVDLPAPSSTTTTTRR